jgi:spore germination cell wall hydrolase CwlJ-like protein
MKAITHEVGGTGMLDTMTFSQSLWAHKINFNDMHCMADNLHHEAKVDGMRGMEAVASVVMNRVRDSRYPDTVCDVVYQPSQFSWTLKKRLKQLKITHDWKTLAVATMALDGSLIDKTGGATHYHAVYVTPYGGVRCMTSRFRWGIISFIGNHNDKWS